MDKRRNIINLGSSMSFINTKIRDTINYSNYRDIAFPRIGNKMFMETETRRTRRERVLRRQNTHSYAVTESQECI